ncbi:MAG: hypothetical protein DU489_08845 [Nitrosomonas sp.]|uniref:hypothetical protein n=1 Tax=Nitrosomonas sp. TaxID=42353 RepID=UPI0032F06A7F
MYDGEWGYVLGNSRLDILDFGPDYEDWRYEEEYRAFFHFDQPDDADGLYYSDFHENLKLVTVIVGVNSYVSCSAVVTLLGNLNGKVVEVFKAKPHSHKFEMTRDQNESLFIK